MRPGRPRVRKVRGPHTILLSRLPPLEAVAAHFVLQERCEDLAGEVFAGHQGHLRLDRPALAVAADVEVPLLQIRWQPADLTLCDHDLQPWIALKGSAEDQV